MSNEVTPTSKRKRRSLTSFEAAWEVGGKGSLLDGFGRREPTGVGARSLHPTTIVRVKDPVAPPLIPNGHYPQPYVGGGPGRPSQGYEEEDPDGYYGNAQGYYAPPPPPPTTHPSGYGGRDVTKVFDSDMFQARAAAPPLAAPSSLPPVQQPAQPPYRNPQVVFGKPSFPQPQQHQPPPTHQPAVNFHPFSAPAKMSPVKGAPFGYGAGGYQQQQQHQAPPLMVDSDAYFNRTKIELENKDRDIIESFFETDDFTDHFNAKAAKKRQELQQQQQQQYQAQAPPPPQHQYYQLPPPPQQLPTRGLAQAAGARGGVGPTYGGVEPLRMDGYRGEVMDRTPSLSQGMPADGTETAPVCWRCFQTLYQAPPQDQRSEPRSDRRGSEVSGAREKDRKTPHVWLPTLNLHEGVVSKPSAITKRTAANANGKAAQVSPPVGSKPVKIPGPNAGRAAGGNAPKRR